MVPPDVVVDRLLWLGPLPLAAWQKAVVLWTLSEANSE